MVWKEGKKGEGKRQLRQRKEEDVKAAFEFQKKSEKKGKKN